MTQPTETQKLLRRLAGQKIGRECEQQALALLNVLIEKPEIIQQQSSIKPQQTISKLESELEILMENQPINEEPAKQLIRQVANAQYDAISLEKYENQRRRHIFTKAERMVELDAGLLRRTVTQIKITGHNAVSIRLKNNQIIERSPELRSAPMSL